MSQMPGTSDWRRQLREELTENILPFWMTHVVDQVNGGLYGAVTNDLQIHNEVPRSAILCARILWTYAAAYQRFGTEQYLTVARWAYETLTHAFWDRECGGLYWQVDYRGNPVHDRKHHYAQAFGIYGLSEYYRATRDAESLALAQEMYHLLEEHAYDPAHRGYVEGSSREWGPLEDMRLSDKEPNCRKSMNTMLHILEAYTNLMQVWNDQHLGAQHRALIEVFQQHIIDHRTHHFVLFFDDPWHSLSENVSYGHDIEGSWLLAEAAEMQGDAELVERVRESAVAMAAAVHNEGIDDDGSIFDQRGPQGLVDAAKSRWAQAEAVVGFYNAYELAGQAQFAQAARRCWQYIQDKLVDRVHGDWYKRLHRDGTPDDTSYKAGPWEGPYHHSRACLEMHARLDNALHNPRHP
jgi:mannobiose 2-epimerase